MPQTDRPSADVLERALMLACRRIADSQQRYEEANTPEGWCEEFIRRANGDIIENSGPACL